MISPARTARFLRFHFLMKQHDWQKVSLWEVRAFGLNDSARVCPNACSSADQGTCGSDGCSCATGFAGGDCSHALCAGSCGGAHGNCSLGACDCQPAFSGETCDVALCPFECWQQGTCEGGVCTCDEGFEGVDCRYRRHGTGVKTLDYPMLRAEIGEKALKNHTDFSLNCVRMSRRI